MAIKQLENPVYRSIKSDGSPNSLGTIGVYVAGTSFTTLATIWDTQTKDTELANPVTLDSAGEAEIWFDSTVDIEVKDADGNLLPQGQTLNIGSTDLASVTGNYNLIQNGSFENDTAGDLAPDNWTLSADAGGMIAIDSTSGGQVHGANGLKFTGTGSGGGSATSTKFDVLAGSAVSVIFTYKSSAVDTTNTVTINWYQFDGSASATASTVAYTETAANPASFTTYIRGVDVPSDATNAEVIIDGVLSSGTDKIGPTWFDDIQVTSIPIDQIIYDSNGNEVFETESVASAVNHLKVTNNSTGLPAVISVEGEVDQGININSADSEEMLRLRATAAAVNELTVTSTATGVPVKLSNDGEDDIGFDINAKNSEEILKLRAVAAAVNEVTVTSAATGNQAKIQGTGEAAGAGLIIEGTGTNSSVNINSPGTGIVEVNNKLDLEKNVVQVVEVEVSAYTSSSTIMIYDDTIPLITEGTQIVSLVITPLYADSILEISFSGNYSANGAVGRIISTIVDATATSTIFATAHSLTSGESISVNFSSTVASPGTSANTYSIRYGPTTANLVYINGDSTARRFGGVSKCLLLIKEIRK